MVATIFEAFNDQNQTPQNGEDIEEESTEKVPPTKPETTKSEEFRNRCGKRETFTNGFDFNGMITKIVKYLIEGITVSLVGMILLMNKNGGKGNYTTQAMEIIAMGVSAAAVFAILDTFAPSISMSTRQGAGFGLGANLVGFPA
tara:strand:+ start:232 stop:663 length:432 start_codon:yes stop_codon:yes gene_type:complete